MGKIGEIVIDGKPVPTPRPRVTNGHAYIPKKARDAQEWIGRKWIEKYGATKVTGPIVAQVMMTFEPPKTWSKKKRAAALAGEIPATSHALGDVDNLAKTALDGLNHIAYEDDSQITGLYVYKSYGEKAQTMIVLIRGREWEEDA